MRTEGGATKVVVVEIQGEVIGEGQTLLLQAVSSTRSSTRVSRSQRISSSDGDTWASGPLRFTVKRVFRC